MGWGTKEASKSEYKTGTEAAGAASQGAAVSTPEGQAPISGGSGTDGWKQVEAKVDGSWFKFEKEGEELIGTYQGDFTGGLNKWGRPNKNVKILTDKGLAMVTLSANLERQLLGLPIGTTVKIVFSGKKFNSKSGNYYREFVVSVKE
jgi:hypothetical protein